MPLISSSNTEPSTSNKRRKTYNKNEDEEQEKDLDAPPNDDSFHSNDYHPLRKNIYLCTNICREFNNDKNPSWTVNGFDVSKALSQFGLNSLLLHDKRDALSDMRLLSLDHIYALANDISSERALSMAKRLELVELRKSTSITVNPTLPVSWLRRSMDPKMKALK